MTELWRIYAFSISFECDFMGKRCEFSFGDFRGTLRFPLWEFVEVWMYDCDFFSHSKNNYFADFSVRILVISIWKSTLRALVALEYNKFASQSASSLLHNGFDMKFLICYILLMQIVLWHMQYRIIIIFYIFQRELSRY